MRVASSRLALTLALFIPNAMLPAQTTLGVSAGVATYDLSGTGNTRVYSAWLGTPIAGSRYVSTELGVATFNYRTQGNTRRTHWLPEAMLQAELPLRRIQPYLGAGLGASLTSGSSAVATVSGALGARALFGTNWIGRGELRVRVIDPWVGTTADWTIGIGRRFGGR